MEKNNYNIKLDPEKLTSADINKHKDFDGLLKQFQAPPTPRQATIKPFYYIGGIVAAALVGVFFYFNWAGNNGAIEQLSTQKYLASQPYINPPFKNVTKEFGKGQIDAYEGGTYTYDNGTKVIVPAAAFTDAKGNVVSGPVDIKYREYHDYIDFFVSGIPMEYDSAGVQYNLESAGMMEIYAEQNGERLKIAPGKDINIEMVSEIMVPANDRANIPKFNVYSLDEEKRNWVYEGRDQMEVLEEDITNLLGEMESIDSIASPQRELQNTIERINNKEKTQLAAIEATVPKPAKPVRPLKENGNDYVFNLDFADEDIAFSRRSNPSQIERELDATQDEINQLHRQYENTLWQVSTQATDFNQQMVEQTNWDDAKIERLNNRDYKLTLINPETTIEVIVNPVLSATDYNNAIADFNQQMTSFEQQLAEREAQLADQKQALAQRMKEERELATKSLEEKIAYYKAKNEDNIATELMITNRVKNRFTVSEFGVWNCDRPLPPFIYNIKGEFVENKSKKQFKHNTAFLIDKNKNTVLRFYASEKADVVYDSKSENMMWMVTKENKIAMCSPDEFKSVKHEDGEHTFVMDLVDQPINSEEDLRKILTF